MAGFHDQPPVAGDFGLRCVDAAAQHQYFMAHPLQPRRHQISPERRSAKFPEPFSLVSGLAFTFSEQCRQNGFLVT
jgi:hypothetical protein